MPKVFNPFFSEFSFVRKGEKISDNKIDRWDKIVRSATQQSGRGDLMSVQDPIPFEKMLEQINPKPGHVGLFAYEGASTYSLKDYCQKVKSEHPEGISDIWIIVGSEGGFSHNEVKAFEKLGLYPVTLGPQVLRVETACMALLSALKYDFDLMC